MDKVMNKKATGDKKQLEFQALFLTAKLFLEVDTLIKFIKRRDETDDKTNKTLQGILLTMISFLIGVIINPVAFIFTILITAYTLYISFEDINTHDAPNIPILDFISKKILGKIRSNYLEDEEKLREFVKSLPKQISTLLTIQRDSSNNDFFYISKDYLKALDDEIKKMDRMLNLMDQINRSNASLIDEKEITVESDLKEVGDNATPAIANKLMVAVLKPQNANTIYDPACGFGSSLVECCTYVKKKETGKIQEICGQDLNPITATSAMTRLSYNYANAHISIGDTLLHPEFSKQFDIVISNPATNFKEPVSSLVHLKQFEFLLRYKDSNKKIHVDWLWIKHVIDAMKKDTGKGAVLLDINLFKRKSEPWENEIKKHIVSNDLVESVILLPKNISPLYKQKTSEVNGIIIVLNKGKNTKLKNKVAFIDMRKVTLNNSIVKNIADTYPGEFSGSRYSIKHYNKGILLDFNNLYRHL